MGTTNSDSPALGGRAGLRPAAVHRHPRPASVVPRCAVRGIHRGAGAADRLVPRRSGRSPSPTGEAGDESLADQSALGLNRLAEKEHQELASLTQAYSYWFGFPLVMAVRDQDSFDQFLRLGERLSNSPTQEHAAALIEIAKIASAPVRPAGGRREPDPLGPPAPPRHLRGHDMTTRPSP